MKTKNQTVPIQSVDDAEKAMADLSLCQDIVDTYLANSQELIKRLMREIEFIEEYARTLIYPYERDIDSLLEILTEYAKSPASKIGSGLANKEKLPSGSRIRTRTTSPKMTIDPKKLKRLIKTLRERQLERLLTFRPEIRTKEFRAYLNAPGAISVKGVKDVHHEIYEFMPLGLKKWLAFRIPHIKTYK